jgi:hypothetical protein
MSLSSPPSPSSALSRASSHGLLVPLGATVAPAPHIQLKAWLELGDDERAPAHSIAMVEVTGDRFVAVVVDTGARTLRWQIADGLDHIALLYKGMQLGVPARDTRIVSASSIVPHAAPPSLAHSVTTSGHSTTTTHWPPLVVVPSTPTTTPGGEPGLVVHVADRHQQAARTVRVEIGGVQGALTPLPEGHALITIGG